MTAASWTFIALAFAWSWPFLIPAVVLDLAADDFPVALLRAASGIGPTVAAVALLYLREDPAVRQDYWTRILQSQSVLMTWIYNSPQRSTLSAVLFHFMVNLTGELFELSARAEGIVVLIWLLAAAAVIVVYRSDGLSSDDGRRQGRMECRWRARK